MTIWYAHALEMAFDETEEGYFPISPMDIEVIDRTTGQRIKDSAGREYSVVEADVRAGRFTVYTPIYDPALDEWPKVEIKADIELRQIKRHASDQS